MKITEQIIKDKALNLGFELVGFANAEILKDEIKKLKNWLLSGYNAGMNYMEKNIDKKSDVKNILPQAKSVIALGMNYYTPYRHENKKDYGKVSRYAWGKDYHLIIEQKLNELTRYLKTIDENFEAVSYVDSGPVMDKVWAEHAGLGWLGKHTNVISNQIGSWFFIATLITNNMFSISKRVEDFCGTCTACINACPTKAILPEGYIVDANKCISYLTIENKNEIPLEFKDKFDNWLFGCDICQDVCPWNHKYAKPTLLEEFYPIYHEMKLEDVLQLTNEEFKNKFKESPISRTKLKGLKRNAEFLLNR